MSIIVTLSGGKASAYCADWALKNYEKQDVILYFNDTKWEHPDLYRFLDDLSRYFNHPITVDADGRTIEELFYDKHAIANNRMPFCSSIMKAERLQKYYKDGDTLVFGIGNDEKQRALRLINIYSSIALRKGKVPKLTFPLIRDNVTLEQINNFFLTTGIEVPVLYKLGFKHNNCSGGCVRAGKKHWKLLLEKLPEVYHERERVEREMRQFFNKDVHILKDETLEHLRERIGEYPQMIFAEEDDKETECIGICSSIA